MVGSTNAKLAPAIGDPDRDSLAVFSCVSTFNIQLSIEDPHTIGTVNLFPFNVPTFKPSNVPTVFALSSAFSIPCALFCTTQILNPFVFKQFQTLLQKHPGWGVPMVSQDVLHFQKVDLVVASDWHILAGRTGSSRRESKSLILMDFQRLVRCQAFTRQPVLRFGRKENALLQGTTC
jgi:hypothetical protein